MATANCKACTRLSVETSPRRINECENHQLTTLTDSLIFFGSELYDTYRAYKKQKYPDIAQNKHINEVINDFFTTTSFNKAMSHAEYISRMFDGVFTIKFHPTPAHFTNKGYLCSFHFNPKLTTSTHTKPKVLSKFDPSSTPSDTTTHPLQIDFQQVKKLTPLHCSLSIENPGQACYFVYALIFLADFFDNEYIEDCDEIIPNNVIQEIISHNLSELTETELDELEDTLDLHRLEVRNERVKDKKRLAVQISKEKLSLLMKKGFQPYGLRTIKQRLSNEAFKPYGLTKQKFIELMKHLKQTNSKLPPKQMLNICYGFLSEYHDFFVTYNQQQKLISKDRKGKILITPNADSSEVLLAMCTLFSNENRMLKTHSNFYVTLEHRGKIIKVGDTHNTQASLLLQVKTETVNLSENIKTACITHLIGGEEDAEQQDKIVYGNYSASYPGCKFLNIHNDSFVAPNTEMLPEKLIIDTDDFDYEVGTKKTVLYKVPGRQPTTISHNCMTLIDALERGLFVDVPFVLDESPIETKITAIYRIESVICHHGTTTRSHFSILRFPDEETMLHIDDSGTKSISYSEDSKEKAAELIRKKQLGGKIYLISLHSIKNN